MWFNYWKVLSSESLITISATLFLFGCKRSCACSQMLSVLPKREREAEKRRSHQEKSVAHVPFIAATTAGGPGTTLVLKVSGLTLNEIILEGQITVKG